MSDAHIDEMCIGQVGQDATVDPGCSKGIPVLGEASCGNPFLDISLAPIFTALGKQRCWQANVPCEAKRLGRAAANKSSLCKRGQSNFQGIGEEGT